MEYYRIDIPSFTIAFLVKNPQGDTVGGLWLRPTTVEVQVPGAWAAHDVRTHICFRHYAEEINAEDGLLIGGYVRLHQALINLREGKGGSHELFGRWNLDLHLTWCEQFQDVRFIGHIPSLYSGIDRALERDPLSCRHYINEIRRFEFWLEPNQLAEPIAQLDGLLAFLETVRS